MDFKRFGLALLIILSLAVPSFGATIGGGGGHQIIDQGLTTLPQQPKLNFTGPAVTCSNNVGESSTDCTISQAGSPPPNLYVKGHTYLAELNNTGFDSYNNSVSGWHRSPNTDWTGVTFADSVNILTTGTGVAKGSPGVSTLWFSQNGIWDAGARSDQQILSAGTGQGTRWKCDNTNNNVMVGLSNDSYGVSYAQIDYAIYCTTSGVLAVYENGVDKTTTYSCSNMSYSTSSVLSIELNSSGYPVYIKDGTTTLCTSTVLPTYPLFADISMRDIDESISDWEIKTTTPTCKLGSGCVGFDSYDDYIKVYGADILPAGYTARTIEAWVYPVSNKNAVIASYGTESANNKASLELGPPALLPEYSYRQKITINSDAVGLSGSLSNIPIAIHIPSSNTAFWTNSNETDGRYVRFTSEHGLLLSFELESWDTTGDDAWWHVKVPTLSSSADTIIYIYYGGGTINGSNKADVWDSNYQAVYHLNADKPEGAFDDSTLNNLDATNNGSVSGTGSVDNGVALTSSENDTVRLPTGSFNSSNNTVEMWVYATANGGVKWFFGVTDNIGTERLNLRVNAGASTVDYHIYDDIDDRNAYIVSGSASVNVYHHIVYTCGSAGKKLFVDGTQTSVADTDTSCFDSIPSRYIDIGGQTTSSTTGTTLEGKEDEVTVSNTVRSNDWIIARYRSGVGTWVSYGTEELNGASATNKLIFRTNGNAVQSTNSVTLNQWNYVAVTLNGTATTLAGTDATLNTSDDAIELYINSSTPETLKTINNSGITETINTSIAELRIGGESNNSKLGGSIRFDGVDDYISIPDNVELEPSTAITVSAWVNPSISNAGGGIVEKWSISGQREWGIRMAAGEPVWFNNGNSIGGPTTTLPANKWSMLTVTHNATDARIYIDGKLVKVFSGAYAQPGTRTSNVEIGADLSLSTYFAGGIDNVRVYSTALSPKDIFGLYAWGVGVSCDSTISSMVLCLPLNETNIETAADLAGTANNGTLNNFTTLDANFNTSGWQNNGVFPGYIDELAVWNVELTGATTPTIAQRYNSGTGTELAGTESGLKLLYHFNDTTNTMLAVQSATVLGIGDDSNNCTSTSTPCKTIAGVLSKIVSKFYAGNSDIQVSSGVYNERVDFQGYNPSGLYEINFYGTFNPTPNSFTDVASIVGSGTSSGTATGNFPKDARSLFYDSGQSFPYTVEGSFLKITGGTGYCADPYTNWHIIEKAYTPTSLSIVGRWTCSTPDWLGNTTYPPNNTTTYSIYNSADLTTLHGGRHPRSFYYRKGGSSYLNNLIYIKNTSGVNVRKIAVRNSGGAGVNVDNSHVPHIKLLSANVNNGEHIVVQNTSSVNEIKTNVLNQGYSGITTRYGSTVGFMDGNYINRALNCGICAFYSAVMGEVLQNYIGLSAYSGMDMELNVSTYRAGRNRIDTGTGSGVIGAGNSSINFVHPQTVSNHANGYHVGSKSTLLKFLRLEDVATDMEILYATTGMSVDDFSSTSNFTQDLTMTGVGTPYSPYSTILLQEAGNISAAAPGSPGQAYIYLKDAGSACQLRGVLYDGTDTLIATLKAAACP